MGVALVLCKAKTSDSFSVVLGPHNDCTANPPCAYGESQWIGALGLGPSPWTFLGCRPLSYGMVIPNNRPASLRVPNPSCIPHTSPQVIPKWTKCLPSYFHHKSNHGESCFVITSSKQISLPLLFISWVGGKKETCLKLSIISATGW